MLLTVRLRPRPRPPRGGMEEPLDVDEVSRSRRRPPSRRIPQHLRGATVLVMARAACQGSFVNSFLVQSPAGPAVWRSLLRRSTTRKTG